MTYHENPLILISLLSDAPIPYFEVLQFKGY